MKINQPITKFIIFTFVQFLCLIYSAKIFASVSSGEINQDSVLLAESSQDNLRMCTQENPPLAEYFYIETANFFANICQKPNGKLIYIGGKKTNPEDLTRMPAIAEEGTGYVAEDENISHIVTGATFSIVKNGKTISEEQVIYYCSQFSKKICQKR